VDALVTAREQVCRDVFLNNENEDLISRAEKILTLEPLPLNEVIHF
jgi:cleavage and polyadenylation specificity factor subunit 2